MPKPMSQARRKLLFELEGIVGNQFYNPYIQNYRPGGVRESDGRALRYPLVFPKPDGTTMKFKDYVVPKDVGQSGDGRRLAVAVDWVEFVRIEAE